MKSESTITVVGYSKREPWYSFIIVFNKNILHIPEGIRLISWATAIRYFGWGFVEMFIPIFLITFVSNYTEIGLLRSVYEIVFLLALPVASHLADHISSKKVILSGLVLYPLIALCYFFGGLYGAVSLIILARVINGVSFALDSVGKKTYMRRYSAHEKIGLVFGYFDTISNFWWLVAAAIGLLLVERVPMYYLFLLIIPTTLIAIMYVVQIPHERKERKDVPRNFVKEIYTDYKKLFLFIKGWEVEQKYMSLLYGLVSTMYVIIVFFIPLVSFEANGSYLLVFLLTTFATLPYIFGVPLGVLADKGNNTILRRVILIGLCLLALLPFISELWLVLTVVFAISMSVYYVSLVLERLATNHEKRANMGSLSGAFLSLVQISQIVAPICIGFFIDMSSLALTTVLITIIGFIIALPLYFKKIQIFDLGKK